MGVIIKWCTKINIKTRYDSPITIRNGRVAFGFYLSQTDLKFMHLCWKYCHFYIYIFYIIYIYEMGLLNVQKEVVFTSVLPIFNSCQYILPNPVFTMIFHIMSLPWRILFLSCGKWPILSLLCNFINSVLTM